MPDIVNNYPFTNNETIDQYVTADLGEGNKINFSSIREINKAFTPRAFSVKYVLEGTETYIVNDKRYIVNAGEYLLVNPSCACEVQVSSNKQVKGICIDVGNSVLEGVSKALYGTALQDVNDFMFSELFFENSYVAKHTSTGRVLTQAEASIIQNPYELNLLTEDFYFQLAESLVADQLSIANKLQAIDSVKHTTRKDLLRRLLNGKEYIDDCFREKIDVADMALAANVSEYHFYRLFKSVFGVTPHQYVLERRLQFASGIISAAHLPLYDVAIQAGFSDIAAFSKAFKKRFGVSPSAISRI